MENTHILLVDDEKSITNYLAPILERSGFMVTVTGDGNQALVLAKSIKPDLVVLDVLLPGLNGREVCRRLREDKDWIPIIMLSCIDDKTEKVLSLEEGADDYLCKPFVPQELIARIRAVLRRVHASTPDKALTMATCLASGNLLFNRQTKHVTLGGKLIDLTPKAVALLEYLMLHPEQVFTREQLMEAVWGWTQATASRAVDVRIAELRRVLGEGPEDPLFIETVVGLGYRFIASVSITEETT